MAWRRHVTTVLVAACVIASCGNGSDAPERGDSPEPTRTTSTTSAPTSTTARPQCSTPDGALVSSIESYLREGVLLRSAQATTPGVVRVEDRDAPVTFMAAEVVGRGLPPDAIGVWARAGTPGQGVGVDLYAVNDLAREHSRLPLEQYLFQEHPEAASAIACTQAVSDGATPVSTTTAPAPNTVLVPDVAGLNAGDAAVRLTGAGLSVYSTTGMDATVARTEPPAGARVARGTRVTIIAA